MVTRFFSGFHEYFEASAVCSVSAERAWDGYRRFMRHLDEFGPMCAAPEVDGDCPMDLGTRVRCQALGPAGRGTLSVFYQTVRSEPERFIQQDYFVHLLGKPAYYARVEAEIESAGDEGTRLTFRHGYPLYSPMGWYALIPARRQEQKDTHEMLTLWLKHSGVRANNTQGS